MKKTLYILAFLITSFAFAQVHTVDMLNLEEKTTAEMNAITIAQGLQEGSRVDNTVTNTTWRYNGTIWVDLGTGGDGVANWNTLLNIPADIADGDDDTQLLKTDIEAMGFFDGAHVVDTNTQLTEGEVDSFVSNNGYSTGPHTVDTNTQLTDNEVSVAFLNENPNTDVDEANDLIVHPESPLPVRTFAIGPLDGLDAMTTPADIEYITDDVVDITTDAYADGVSVTGTSTKTLTISRNGLPDISTTFSDDGGAGGSDGNDFLLGVTESSDVITFNVQNQTDPTFDIGAYIPTNPTIVNKLDASAYTAGDVLTKIKTVDGIGSGLDAELFQGNGISSSGNRWGILPLVGATGAIEIGKYIDFHDLDNDTGDYDVRLNSNGSDLLLNGTKIYAGPHTADTNTQLNETQVDAFVANNGYSTGSHTIDTKLSEAQVDSYVANNGYANLSGATFIGAVSVPDQVYGPAWDGSTQTLTKNAIYDKIESLTTPFVYETGTWTPVLTAVGGGSYSYTVTFAEYSRVGKSVTISLRLSSILGTDGIGNLRLSGLPYVGIAEDQPMNIMVDLGAGGSPSFYFIQATVNGGSSYMDFQYQNVLDTGNQTFMANVDFGIGSVIYISGTYLTTSSF